MSIRLTHPDNTTVIVEAATEANAERYLSQGWRIVPDDAPTPDAPLKDWRAYARTQGLPAAWVKNATRDELRDACS